MMIDIEDVKKYKKSFLNKEHYFKVSEEILKKIKNNDFNFTDEEKTLIIIEALSLRDDHPLIDFNLICALNMFNLVFFKGNKDELIYKLVNSLENQVFFILKTTILQSLGGMEEVILSELLNKEKRRINGK